MFRARLKFLRASSRPFSSSTSQKPLWGSPLIPSDEASSLIELTVNGTTVRVPPGTTIMQAASTIGVDIPRFCYHERLKIAGNCRMCLVQVNGGPKLMASCAAPAGAKMVVETESSAVKKAREGVMEFLLANHPLDCPICDQGGECDLQEQAMAFGSDRSRFRIAVEEKRAVEDKNFGPLIKTSMNRCIHCTRCVRFANEVAGVDDLGTTGRGNEMQIGTYIEKTIGSELSGNVIDLCPVGALTSKPYAFMTRPWELRKTESIDVMDAVGSNIRVDSRGQEVMRILPRLNESINEEWLGDKSRFACDALRQQRLTTPLIRRRVNGDLQVLTETSWEDALLTAATRIRECPPEGIEVITGPFTDMETLFLMKQFMTSIGCNNLYFDGDSLNAAPLPSGPLALFNAGIAGIESADSILLIGSNPRTEAPIVNARIRKAYLRNPDLRIGLLGELPSKGLTYEVEHLGRTVGDFHRLEKSPFWDHFKEAKRPAIIVGQAVYDAGAFSELLNLVKQVPRLFQSDRNVNWNGYCFLPLHASRTGALSLGWSGGKKRVKKAAKIVYLLGADEIGDPSGDIHPDAFVIYQGHHGDRGAQLADLVLPGAAYTEKDASWMNMEGRIQRSRTAVPPPGDARPDWQIVRALAEVAGLDLTALDTGHQVTAQMMRQVSLAGDVLGSLEGLAKSNFGGAHASTLLRSPVRDYYLTDCISRASPTMAACSQQLKR